ncbi:MAG: CAP domain-containing protein [Gemmataceae bacterium]
MIRSLSRLSLLMLVPLTASFVLAEDKKESTKFEMTKDEQTLLELLNKERTKADLPALKPNPMLFKAARGHSANMAKQEKMEHVLDGKRPAQRVEATGYNWGKVSENIAVSQGGQPPLAVIVKSWMDSKTHRENLLSNRVTETGLGIARNAKGEIYYTQVFARPQRVKK